MRQRRVWTPEEDKVLKHLKEEQKIKKWSAIAKTMQDQYQMPNRTGKQCRERYFNHLDSQIKHQQWTQQEERILWQFHSQYGNRWTLMTSQLKGRSQNCIKNHFYSKLRKAVRRLNKIIAQKLKGQHKQIKTSLLYKILQASEDKFRLGKSADIQTMDMAVSIKNRLFLYQFQKVQKGKEIEIAKKLVKDISKIEQRLKTQSKNQKNSSGFLDPRSFRRLDQSFQSEDNFSVYSSNSFNTSLQPSDDDESVIISHSDSKVVRLNKTQSVQERNLQQKKESHPNEEKMEEQKQQYLHSSLGLRPSSGVKVNSKQSLLGDDLLKSFSLRPSRSQKGLSFQLSVEDKVSDIEGQQKQQQELFQRCISDIAKYESSQDQFDFGDELVYVKSQGQKQDFHHFFDDPDPMEFQLRVLQPKVPSDDGKMLDDFDN